MTEPTYDPQPTPVVKAARDLREIERLAGELHAQAVDDSGSKLMPGGKAMVALAPVSSIEAWEHRQESTERTGKAYTNAEDEDPDDIWPPLQTLAFWTEQLRRDRGEDYGQRPTLVSEAGYLRFLLPVLWETELGWDDMCADIRRARARLEDIVHDGQRAEQMRVTCPKCDEAPRLIRIHDWPEYGEDGYKCSACRERFDQDAYERAYAKQLRSEGAERYVPLPDAIATLRLQGRSERTIRKWLGPVEDAEDVVESYCEVQTRRVWAWWPALWTRHLLTETRKRRDVA